MYFVSLLLEKLRVPSVQIMPAMLRPIYELRTFFAEQRAFAAADKFAAAVDVDDLRRCAAAAAATFVRSGVEAWCTVDCVRRHFLGAAAADAEPVIKALGAATRR